MNEYQLAQLHALLLEFEADESRRSTTSDACKGPMGLLFVSGQLAKISFVSDWVETRLNQAREVKSEAWKISHSFKS